MLKSSKTYWFRNQLDTEGKEAPNDIKITGDWFTVPNRIVKDIK